MGKSKSLQIGMVIFLVAGLSATDSFAMGKRKKAKTNGVLSFTAPPPPVRPSAPSDSRGKTPASAEAKLGAQTVGAPSTPTKSAPASSVPKIGAASTTQDVERVRAARRAEARKPAEVFAPPGVPASSGVDALGGGGGGGGGPSSKAF